MCVLMLCLLVLVLVLARVSESVHVLACMSACCVCRVCACLCISHAEPAEHELSWRQVDDYEGPKRVAAPAELIPSCRLHGPQSLPFYVTSVHVAPAR